MIVACITHPMVGTPAPPPSPTNRYKGRTGFRHDHILNRNAELSSSNRLFAQLSSARATAVVESPFGLLNIKSRVTSGGDRTTPGLPPESPVTRAQRLQPSNLGRG